jgi:hypothetical protein
MRAEAFTSLSLEKKSGATEHLNHAACNKTPLLNRIGSHTEVANGPYNHTSACPSIVDTLIAYVGYCFRHKVLQSICHEFRQ